MSFWFLCGKKESINGSLDSDGTISQSKEVPEYSARQGREAFPQRTAQENDKILFLNKIPSEIFHSSL